MENKHVLGPRGSTRRAFLSVSAVTAAAAPMLALTTSASAAAADTGLAVTGHGFDPDLRAMLREVDPGRIQAIIRRLTQFGTRHTLSSQTDPVRGIGAATAWVSGQMRAKIGRAHV